MSRALPIAAAPCLALVLGAGAPAPLPYKVNLATAGWGTYADGSADRRFPLANTADGALTFVFPHDAPPFFTAAGRSPTAPSADYLFAAVAPDLRQAHALTAVFTIAASPGAAFNARFEAANTCPGGPTVRLLVASAGPLTNWRGATLPYTRWYSAPIPLAPGPHTLTVPLTGAAWTDVFGDRADAEGPPAGQSQAPAQGFQAALAAAKVGLVFGGGCFAGHGVGVASGTATFALTSYTIS